MWNKLQKLLVFIVLLSFNCCDYDDYKEDVILDILTHTTDKRLKSYDAVPVNKKQMLWNEEFDNNNSKFPFDITEIQEVFNNYTTATLENGVLTISMDSIWQKIFEIPICFEPNKNYEIEIKYKYEKQNPDLLHIILQSDNGLCLYKYFPISRDKEVIWLADFFYDKLEYIYYRNSDIFWNDNDFNTITIRKIGYKFSIFINHKIYHIVDIENDTLKTLKLVVNNGTNMFDYIRVQYIND